MPSERRQRVQNTYSMILFKRKSKHNHNYYVMSGIRKYLQGPAAGSSGGTFCAGEDVLDLVLGASYTDGYCNALKLISEIWTIYC